jgi:hypothetical protein
MGTILRISIALSKLLGSRQRVRDLARIAHKPSMPKRVRYMRRERTAGAAPAARGHGRAVPGAAYAASLFADGAAPNSAATSGSRVTGVRFMRMA